MCASWAEQGALRQDTSNKQRFKPCVLSLPGAFLRDYLSATPTVSSKSLTAFLVLLCPLQQGRSQAGGPLPWLRGLSLLPALLPDVEKSGCESLGPHSWRRRSRGGKSHHAHHTPPCLAASSSSHQEQKSKAGRAGIAEPLKSKTESPSMN